MNVLSISSRNYEEQEKFPEKFFLTGYQDFLSLVIWTMYYSQLKLNRWFFPKPLLLKSEKFLFHYSFGATKLEDLLLIQGFSTIFF